MATVNQMQRLQHAIMNAALLHRFSSLHMFEPLLKPLSLRQLPNLTLTFFLKIPTLYLAVALHNMRAFTIDNEALLSGHDSQRTCPHADCQVKLPPNNISNKTTAQYFLFRCHYVVQVATALGMRPHHAQRRHRSRIGIPVYTLPWSALCLCVQSERSKEEDRSSRDALQLCSQAFSSVYS